MEFIELLTSSPPLLIVTSVVISLLVGSFLNVVIYRLPIMLDREWRSQSQQLLASPPAAGTDTLAADATFNLVTPNSCCPRCRTPIRAWQNIPVLSYLFLRGKCAKCGEHIALRYPIVEALTALLSAVVVWKFGFTIYSAAGLLMTWMLIALSLIDFDTQLLPDQLTLPLVWIGLLLSLWATPDNPFARDMQSSIIGGVAGYLSLWSVYWLFKLLTGKEGMGYGDFKLLAAFGTWLGWQALPLIVLLSAFAGAVIGIGLIAFRGRDRNIPIPFGPYLAIAGWIAMLWGDTITQRYLQLTGLNGG
jgi:leader peptidase (prepilin peptidase) / N-methyltransferase